MSLSDNDNENSQGLSRAEKIALAREEQKQRLKQKAKVAKEAYLARPEVQAKIAAQKEKIAARRKEKSDALKAARKAEKSALAAAKKTTHERKQNKRDQELAATLEVAAQLSTKAGEMLEGPIPGRIGRPLLTVISGGRSSIP